MANATTLAEDGLHIVIVGAGIAGLSAAISTKLANPSHKITILETVKELQEVGVSTVFRSQACQRDLLTPSRPVYNSRLMAHAYSGNGVSSQSSRLEPRRRTLCPSTASTAPAY